MRTRQTHANCERAEDKMNANEIRIHKLQFLRRFKEFGVAVESICNV
jgi:hypothetical protein